LNFCSLSDSLSLSTQAFIPLARNRLASTLINFKQTSMSSFDDMPVGSSRSSQPSEYAPGESAPAGGDDESLLVVAVAKKPTRPPPARFAKAAAPAIVESSSSSDTLAGASAVGGDEDTLINTVAAKPTRPPPARFARPAAVKPAAAAAEEDSCIVVAAPKPRAAVAAAASTASAPAAVAESVAAAAEDDADFSAAPQRVTDSPPLRGTKKVDPWDDPSAYPDAGGMHEHSHTHLVLSDAFLRFLVSHRVFLSMSHSLSRSQRRPSHANLPPRAHPWRASPQ